MSTYELLTINKTYKYRERVNASSQTYRDGTNLQEILPRKEKNNDIVDGTENLSEPGKQLDNHRDSNTDSLKKTRLEGKFVSKNVINLSRINLSRSEISLLSKGLKFVPSANKIDRAKLKRELEENGRKLRQCGILGMMNELFQLINSDLTLLLILGEIIGHRNSF